MLTKTLFATLLLAMLAGGRSVLAQSTSRGPDRPFYYTRPITDDDLFGRSLRELSLLRNTIYARAGNKFRKKWLNDYFSAQPWYHPLDKMDESKITALDRKNAETIAKYDADIPREELLAMQRMLLDSQSEEDKIELRLVSMRLGKWAGSLDQERTPLEDPTLLDKQITVDSLKDFSRRDLRLIRNLIYARRGRPFKSDLLKGYFAAVDWYKPDPAYTDARLTPLDKRNINVILSVENSLGGPLTDWEHKREDGWFANA
ncbi:MAG TPA: YARHG domain-containing protein [Candidatus Angelobacter sp.]|nr:YARHG domain-containing protein [Candidatus Angelobacter sp.]